MRQNDDRDDDSKGGKSEEHGPRFKTEVLRDDLLSPEELKRILKVHVELHKASVDKQKILRKDRAEMKEGRKQTQNHQIGRGQGQAPTSRFKQHPISNKAQFSGIDRQVSNVPTQYDANTNDKARDQNENRYENKLENRLEMRNQPKHEFNPKPRPY